VYVSNFIVMNAYYAWSRPGAPTKAVQGHYGEIRSYLIEARDILEAAGIAVNVRYAPLCTMRGLERNLVGIVGVRHDPHEWMNAIDHTSPGDAAAMGRRLPLKDHEAQYQISAVRDRKDVIATRAGKLFPTNPCASCRALPVCDGVDPNYLARRGAGELVPYEKFRGDLLDRERLAYKAAHVVKLKAFAPARAFVSDMLAAPSVAA
jgi:pyrroloquinoline quinone biosynthesis protein E